MHELLLEVDVSKIESDRLRTAEPGGVDELDERLVAKREWPFAGERVDEAFDLAQLRRVGQPARTLRCERSVGHVFGAKRIPEE